MRAFIQNRGFMPVLIALGVVSMLAAMSMSLSLTSMMVQKKVVKRLNRIEGFYSNELAVWHQYFRSVEKLAGADPNPDGTFNLSIDNDYSKNIYITPDSYSNEPGVTLNIMTTAPLAPATKLIRRYTAGNVVYGVGDPLAANCAATRFVGKKSREKLCLAVASAQESTAAPWLVGDASRRCVFLSDSKGVQCWGTNASGAEMAGIGNKSARPVWLNGLKSGVDGLWSFGLGILLKTGSEIHQYSTINSRAPAPSNFKTAAGTLILGGNVSNVPFPLHILTNDGTVYVLQNNVSPSFLNDWKWTDTQCPGGNFCQTHSEINNASLVSVGAAHACAALLGGGVKCWGQNQHRQLGNPMDALDSMGGPFLQDGSAI